MSEHQFERMLPWQLRAASAARPVAYIPLGTYEWHGEHLPVGLDALTSHGLCLRAAEADGGIVLPPLYYGTGGGHGEYPWTIMMPEPCEIERQLGFTLDKLKSFGIKLVVLFSGHFPPEQLAMIDRQAHAHTDKQMKVLSCAVSRMGDAAFAPDHAALFETTLLAALHPDLVQVDKLPPRAIQKSLHPEDPFGPQRHDPKHDLYGIFGPDPRQFDPADARGLLNRSVDWLLTQVRQSI